MTAPAATITHRDQSSEGSGRPDPSTAERADTHSQALYKLIEQQPFFKGLNTHHLQLLTDSALEMQFEPGDSILQEGSPANRFYLILEGKVVLEAELQDRVMIPVQTLGPGDDLGWSWLFPPYSLHSTARALEPTKTIFFYGTRLREQCEQDHDLGYHLMNRVAEVVIQRLRATQQRLAECSSAAKPSDR
jgi:CRP/FNR family cyclic AMP-dependent transcriptional regulator